ncbi:superoxide dismutase family protein [Marinactinospora thermotolerans]|uniref:Superoxide dismutase, Cu-Zn family n=1 Tax=Marinactinospora thermotolerans DSM 45154 TaxID=1122192 RepID=A0A1T4N716_9ACTN|nr:superoxide dismutase family protein [Marinactinospora thermotolerans]SJZ74953.1 superoxide dismutase, Cu-Zn family [Marinactinospora thermotolerans DSM 45154]
MRSTSTALGLAALTALLLSGCQMEEAPRDAGAPPDPTPTDRRTTEPGAVTGDFQSYSEDATAVTYDPEAVPEGASVNVSVTSKGAPPTIVTMGISGLQPDRDYGAHVHTKPCGAAPDDSGPHYQNEEDPQQPSTDPKYANPDNEIWLDFTTDADGSADASASVDWVPRQGEANSIVIHAEHTHTEPGHAGQAGDRLACINVPL